MLAVLKQEGISEKEAQVIAIPQPEIVAAWKRGDIDGAFVWDPALTELKKDGKVLLTSGQVADRGAPTFSAIVATGPFLKEHPDFVTQYADLVDGYFRSYRSDAAAWSVDSENVKLISNLQGGTPEVVVEQLKATIGVPPLEEQTSDKWLGGGENGGVAKILKDTAYFLKDQKKITAVKDTYGEFADPQYAEAAKALSN